MTPQHMKPLPAMLKVALPLHVQSLFTNTAKTRRRLRRLLDLQSTQELPDNAVEVGTALAFWKGQNPKKATK